MESDENEHIASAEEVICEEVAPGIDFNDYVTCDDGLPICATDVYEIDDLSEQMDSDSEEEIDNEAPN